MINDTSATFILTKDKKVTGFRILNFKDEEQAFHDGDFNITLLGHSPAPPEEFTLTDDVDVLGVDETGTILELFDKVGGVVTDTVTLTSPPGNLVTEKRGQIYF